jgi:hypothetical protein
MHGLTSATHDLSQSFDLTRHAAALVNSITDAFESGLLLDVFVAIIERGAAELDEAASSAVLIHVQKDMKSKSKGWFRMLLEWLKLKS